jgi:endonuclease/exonuclease/phosphatase family metal-dependent hydrolase
MEFYMRLISYNILNPYHAVKWNTLEGLVDSTQEDNWTLGRREQIFKNLQDAQFDLACIQEVSARTLPEFKKVFTVAGYFPHMSYDEPESEHGTAVLYNNDSVSLLQCRELISPTIKQRSATLADFKILNTQRVIRVISVHLKGYNPYEEDLKTKRKSQEVGDQELHYYIQDIQKDLDQVDAIMIAGDFNEDTDEMNARGDLSRQGILMQMGFVWDQQLDITESRSGRKIDWIFYKDLKVNQAGRLSSVKHVTPIQNRAASDHAITACDIV